MNPKLTDFLALLGGLIGILSGALSIVKEMTDTYRWPVPSWLVIACSVLLLFVVIKLQWSRRVSAWVEWVNSKIEHYRPTMILGALIVSLTVLGVSCYLMMSLRQISHVSGTRFVGKFPENMIAINQLIRSAKRELIIVGDQIAYGAFSKSEEHKEYLNALLDVAPKLQNGLRPKIMFYNANVAKDAVRVQLRLNDDKDSLSPGLKIKAKSWMELAENRGYKGKAPETVAEFAQLLEWKNEFVRNQLSGTCEIRHLNEKIPVFIWIADGNTAIFSFNALDEQNQPKEVSFFTNDPNTIEILKLIYLNNWEKK